MRRIRLVIAYRGTNYSGWAKQDGDPTIQETLEDALEKVVQKRTSVLGSSRTDAGVHALGQVAAFSTESTIFAEKFLRAINFYLPHDIRVVEAEEVSSDFHPLRNAVKKEYLYVIDDQLVPSPFLQNMTWIPRQGRFDVAKMEEAAKYLVGTHDFASFQAKGSPRTSTERTIFRATVRRESEELFFGLFYRPLVLIEVEGNGFLYNMMRIIAGTLAQVGNGERPPEWVRDVILAKNRVYAGPTAPPDGLYLKKIEMR